MSDGTVLHALTGHSVVGSDGDFEVRNPVYSVDFSPDGVLLATSGADGTAQLWRVSDGQRVRILEGGGITFRASPGSVAKFSADGRTLYTLGDGIIKFWRVADGRLLATFENTGATCLAVGPDGKHFAYGTSAGALALARVPLWIDQVEHAANQLIVRWQGGSGRYRIQRRNSLTRGAWHNFGPPTTATSLTNKITRKPVFYRVQSLPNP